jgi:hypothetical protein
MIPHLIGPLAIGSLLLGSASAFAFTAASSGNYSNIHGYLAWDGDARAQGATLSGHRRPPK